MPADSMVIEFIRYDVWANQTLLQACEGLSSEQLAASAAGTYGTVARTIEHLVDSETFYLALLTGQTLPAPFRWEDQPPVSAIRAHYATVGEAVLAAAGRVSPDDVVHEQGQGWTYAYKALTLLIQIVNHGVEHRTNITTILSGLGVATPEIDGWGYLSTHRERLGP